MKKQILTLSLISLLTLPAALFAAEHSHNMSGMGGMDHGSMGKMEHGDSMSHAGMSHKGMLSVGEQTVNGVRAAVYLNDVKATMAKMGMKETHHLMIHLFDAKSGKTLEDGTTAVKIKGPDGIEGTAMKTMGMEGHFGVDVILEKKGPYVFTIGTKLADGVSRKFELKYDLK